MNKKIIAVVIALITTVSFAKTTLSYKVKGKNADFKFILSEVNYKGQRVLLSEGYSTIKYGIFYKGGFDFRGYNTLKGDMILNVKCNWKSRRTKTECTRVRFNGDETFAHYVHKSTDLSLNENFINLPQTQTLKIRTLQPDMPKNAIIYDASSLIVLTPFLNFENKTRSTIIYTNYKNKVSKSKVWVESERGDIQVLKVTPIHPEAREFKTLIIKINYNKKRKLVTSFVQKVPVLGNMTIELVNVEKN